MAHWVWRPIPFMEDCARRYGDCFTVRFPLFGRPGDRPPLVFMSDPEAVREIFTGDENDLLAGEANAPLEPIVGRHSLLLLDGAHHMHERRLMMPPFHGERMQAYGDVMRDVADSVIADWPLERPFPLHPHMQRITLSAASRRGAASPVSRARSTRCCTTRSGGAEPWAVTAATTSSRCSSRRATRPAAR
jgi:cytochrome P450